MSDPFCLALTVVPILSVWGGGATQNEDEDTVTVVEGAKDDDATTTTTTTRIQKLFTQDSYYEGAFFQGWWQCVGALPCQPCAPDCFFQLDDDEDEQVLPGADNEQGDNNNSSPET